MDMHESRRFVINTQYFLNGIKVIFVRPKRVLKVLKNLFYDLKYTRSFLGIPLNNQNDLAGFTQTTSTEYSVLEKLFSNISIAARDVIVDVGCGKGRVLAWLMHKKIPNKVIGVEVDPSVASETKKRMRRYKQIEILTGDVTEEAFPLNGTIFYLFNPFGELVMRKFIKKIENNLLGGGLTNRFLIVYYNCAHLNAFEENPIWKIKKCGDLDGLPSAIISAELL
ncbi:MAG: GCN5-related N-acetyltransferase [uncultured bacterium]|nr:MAG: GCN5-related N-acetyltransferase [uncultured bacterium]